MKSTLIEHRQKSWQLRIVYKKPENTPEVDMAMYRNVTGDFRDEAKNFMMKQRKENSE